MRSGNFRGANLQNARLLNANLERAIFDGADLRKCDLANSNLRGASLRGSYLDHADLEMANLRNAELNRADLKSTNLLGADLQNAHLTDANLGNANLTGAKLEAALLEGTFFKDAVMSNARVYTFREHVDASGNRVDIRSDLSQVRFLTQDQLETMEGDSGAILPEGLYYPRHWTRYAPNTDKTEPAKDALTPTPESATSVALLAQASFLIATAPAAADTARFSALQIEDAVSRFHKAVEKNHTEEGDLLHAVARVFKSLADTIEAADADQTKIATLEATIAAQQAEIERLTGLLANAPTARQQIIVGALGAAGGVALTSGAGYIFGPEGQQIITNLIDLIRGGGGAPPTLPPSIGT